MDFSPFFVSIRVAILATFITFFLGVFSANFVYKLKRGKGMIDSIFTLPMILPPTVVGFFLLLIFGRNGLIGGLLHQIGVQIVFTWYGAVVASTVVAFPLMYRTTRGAFEQVDQNIIHAAETLGFSRSKIFWRIKVPMAKSGILAGTVLAFARALGEFGATIMLAGNIPGRTQTMAIAVFSAASANNRELAFTWVVILSLISFGTIVMMNRLSDSNKNNKKRRKDFG
ncbi:MAG: molybdate ABC transporter permease subunit [Lachnospiraceae bacterium]|nr:molybdate ABC transporter permease subunit [Lachnospiraceae bacterium]